MDIIKSGNFICEQRKKLGLTQKELANKIGVSDKAVSNTISNLKKLIELF